MMNGYSLAKVQYIKIYIIQYLFFYPKCEAKVICGFKSCNT